MFDCCSADEYVGVGLRIFRIAVSLGSQEENQDDCIHAGTHGLAADRAA